MPEKNLLKQILIGLGFIEIKHNLWLLECGSVQLYHDYRNGTRKSYGYNHNIALSREEMVNMWGYKFIKEVELKIEEKIKQEEEKDIQKNQG